MTKTEVIRNYGSLSLAYIGDGAWELLCRKYILSQGITDNGKMHLKTKALVSAAAQSEFLDILESYLTDDEQDVVRRGRNVKSHSHPKNADIANYHRATGFEALCGYLHLAGDDQRLEYLFDIIVKTIS